MTEFKRGDRVMYKAGGKVARLEGKTGWLPATVTEVWANGEVIVMADHREEDGAQFAGMGTCCMPCDVRKIN